VLHSGTFRGERRPVRLGAGVVAVVLVGFLVACEPVNIIPIPVAGGGTASSKIVTAVGCVADVNVTLRGLTHPSPDDLDVLLEGPDGKSVVLMSDVGGSSPVAGVDLTFEDESRTTLADGDALASGTFRPTDPEPGDVFGPAGPHGGALSVFDGSPATGAWTLHVIDDGPADEEGAAPAEGAGFAGGWALTVTRCGQSRPAVVRQSVDWYLRDSLSAGDPTTLFTFGTRPLAALLGDWDGDGTATPGTYERGTFHLSNTTGPPITFAFGDDRGYPVAGDFDDDGRDDVAVFRNGTWEIRHVDDGTVELASFGTGTWPATVPLAGDWNGDGVDGLGTWSAGAWVLRDSPVGNGPADQTFTLGPAAGAYPVVGDWTGIGVDAPGFFEGKTWTVFFDDPFLVGDRHSVLTTFEFGQPGDLPLAGP